MQKQMQMTIVSNARRWRDGSVAFCGRAIKARGGSLQGREDDRIGVARYRCSTRVGRLGLDLALVKSSQGRVGLGSGLGLGPVTVTLGLGIALRCCARCCILDPADDYVLVHVACACSSSSAGRRGVTAAAPVVELHDSTMHSSFSGSDRRDGQ